MFNFTSTCQRLKVEPWAYLKDVLSRLPGLAQEQLADLLPDCWQVPVTARIERRIKGPTVLVGEVEEVADKPVARRE